MYATGFGRAVLGDASEVIAALAEQQASSANLIFTSPPFPLLRKKKYGNREGEEYLEWLRSFAPSFRKLLADDGSLVLEIGNAWNPGQPTMSTLPLRALMALMEAGQFHLCQQFVWSNTAKLPSPAQWVNVERVRLKDSHTHIWWLAKAPRPKASNRKVLTTYSPSMRRLLKTRSYNAGPRPSEHSVGATSFARDNGGAIPGSVITGPNTDPSVNYNAYCRARGLTPHPARMPEYIARFFIRLLTEEGDLVVDPFAGSNTTGWVAEDEGRRWLAVDLMEGYLHGSKGRFDEDKLVASASCD